MVLEDEVVVALLVEGELILEAGAAAAANADAQTSERVGACAARNSRTFSAPFSVIVIIASIEYSAWWAARNRLTVGSDA